MLDHPSVFNGKWLNLLYRQIFAPFKKHFFLKKCFDFFFRPFFTPKTSFFSKKMSQNVLPHCNINNSFFSTHYRSSLLIKYHYRAALGRAFRFVSVSIPGFRRKCLLQNAWSHPPIFARFTCAQSDYVRSSVAVQHWFINQDTRSLEMTKRAASLLMRKTRQVIGRVHPGCAKQGLVRAKPNKH